MMNSLCKEISINDFCSVFTNRKFSIKDRAFKKIFVVYDDSHGCLTIEERVSGVALVVFCFTAPFLALYAITMNGLKVLPDIFKEVAGFRRVIRSDDCRWGLDTTDSIMKICNVEFINGELRERIDNA